MELSPESKQQIAKLSRIQSFDTDNIKKWLFEVDILNDNSYGMCENYVLSSENKDASLMLKSKKNLLIVFMYFNIDTNRIELGLFQFKNINKYLMAISIGENNIHMIN